MNVSPIEKSLSSSLKTNNLEEKLKAQKEKVKREEKYKQKAQAKAKTSRFYTDKINNYKLEIQDLSQKVNARLAYYKYAEKCAIIIQKVYRGHLTRHLYAKEVLHIKGFTTNKIIEEAKVSGDNNLFYTGKKTIWAANVINRFMKRMIFLLKIRRLEQVFVHLKALKEAEACIYLRVYIRAFNANMMIKHEKFLRYRFIRLQEIRQNLAILSIKNYYQSSHINFRILRKRIILFKRRLKKNSSQQSKFFECASTRDRMTSQSELVSTSSNENFKAPVENLGNIIECASITSTEFLQMEKDRKDKITGGLLAYSVPKAKEPLPLLPFLYQKDMQEAISPNSYCNATFTVVNRMNQVSPRRFTPKRLRKALPVIDKKPPVKTLPKKLIWTREEQPNFSLPTASSAWGKKSEEDIPEAKPVVKKREHRYNTTLFNSTITAMLKLKDPNYRARSHFRSEMVEDIILCSYEKTRAVTRVKERPQASSSLDESLNLYFQSPCVYSETLASTVSTRMTKYK
ncbi:hypothetical protein SteCoe_2268 [Stentor coeruleus]|uniref:Uncharacterized protein n=1 Tax=Stentor coeruleus TaxID=5963 RepID=A0A1R2CZR1_9CILI|nr:hypothetical protein SteCoe_2268 [Stentor coeruleus]